MTPTKSKTIKTASLRSHAIDEICYTIKQVFAFQVWSANSDDFPFPQLDHGYNVLRNASIESSLLGIRKLDDYFSPLPKKRKNFSDDLHVIDFLQYERQHLLSASDRQVLNKQLAHFTSHSVTHGEFDWYFDVLTLRAATLCLDFFDFLLRKHRLKSRQKRLQILDTRLFIFEYLDWMSGFDRNSTCPIWASYRVYVRTPNANRPHWLNFYRSIAPPKENQGRTPQ